jgi:hypothetical protein
LIERSRLGGELKATIVFSEIPLSTLARIKSNRKESEMKRTSILLLLAGATIAGCTPTEQGAGIGAASGAVIGGVATGNVRGAAVGAAIGGVTGAVIGNVAGRPGQCYFRDRYGRRYIASCPR